jgi:glycerol uptake operon antiterminator
MPGASERLLWEATSRYKIVPVVGSRGELSQILAQTSPRPLALRYCNLFDLAATLEQARRRGYQFYLDIDTCDGIHPDEAGIRYLAERLQISGIGSHNPRVLALGKRQGLLTIQRFFVLDSTGLESELSTIDFQMIDALNISPALVIPHIVQWLNGRLPVPFLGSGLVSNHEQVKAIIGSGALGVMTARTELWS